MQIQRAIQDRVQHRGPGSVFTPADFLDLGTRAAVDQALSRMAQHGDIRRIDRGLYDVPRRHPRVGALWPSAAAVAQALAGRTDAALQPSGPVAANTLGLSTQVPATVEYLTDGPSRHVRVGNLDIRLRHASQLDMLLAGTRAGLALLALRHLGQGAVDDAVVRHLATLLDDDEKRSLIGVRKRLPGWLRGVIDRIAADAT